MRKTDTVISWPNVFNATLEGHLFSHRRHFFIVLLHNLCPLDFDWHQRNPTDFIRTFSDIWHLIYRHPAVHPCIVWLIFCQTFPRGQNRTDETNVCLLVSEAVVKNAYPYFEYLMTLKFYADFSCLPNLHRRFFSLSSSSLFLRLLSSSTNTDGKDILSRIKNKRTSQS